MYAIVKTGGKQYKVAEGDVLTIEKLEVAPGASVALPAILLVDGTDVTTDADALAKVAVTAQVLAATKGPKIRIHKYKNKTGYHKRMGHRQPLTQIKVDRAMLHHPQAAAELDLVMRVARDPVEQGTSQLGRAVIVEGVDNESPLTLKDIYDRKIRHIQGYITRTPASPELRALSDEIRQDLAARVRGDDEERPSGEHSLRRGA